MTRFAEWMFVCKGQKKKLGIYIIIGCVSWLENHAVCFGHKNRGPWSGTGMTVAIPFDRYGSSVPYEY